MPREIDLTPYQVQRPEKVDWQFELTTPTVLESIKSKGLRSFLRKAPEILLEKGLSTVFEPISEANFAEWLPFYQAKMTEQGYTIMASPEWLSQRQAQGWQLYGLWIRQGDQLVGSGVMSVHDGVGTLHFKASDRIDLSSQSNSSLGVVIDYLFAQHVHELGVTTISGGRSRNAFGVFNTLGYLDFKLKFGYVPGLPSDLPLISTVPVNDEGVVAFCGVRTAEPTWALFSISPANWSGQLEAARFTSEKWPLVNLNSQL